MSDITLSERVARLIRRTLRSLGLWLLSRAYDRMHVDATPADQGPSDQALGLVGRRDGRWPAVRMAHLERFPACAFCGSTNRALLEVHHIEPYHVRPSRELDPSNLVTLCRLSDELDGFPCHLHIGHLGDFQAFNPRVRACCEKWSLWLTKGKP